MLIGHSKVVSDGQFTLKTQVMKLNYTVEFGHKHFQQSYYVSTYVHFLYTSANTDGYYQIK